MRPGAPTIKEPRGVPLAVGQEGFLISLPGASQGSPPFVYGAFFLTFPEGGGGTGVTRRAKVGRVRKAPLCQEKASIPGSLDQNSERGFVVCNVAFCAEKGLTPTKF